jgi:prolyl 4-hydroxylase
MYLNDVEEGGETYFRSSKLKIKPRTGKAVIWHNVNDDGELDFTSRHAALRVKKGGKWIMTKWIRERRFE